MIVLIFAVLLIGPALTSARVYDSEAREAQKRNQDSDTSRDNRALSFAVPADLSKRSDQDKRSPNDFTFSPSPEDSPDGRKRTVSMKDPGTFFKGVRPSSSFKRYNTYPHPAFFADEDLPAPYYRSIPKDKHDHRLVYAQYYCAKFPGKTEDWMSYKFSELDPHGETLGYWTSRMVRCPTSKKPRFYWVFVLENENAYNVVANTCEQEYGSSYSPQPYGRPWSAYQVKGAGKYPAVGRLGLWDTLDNMKEENTISDQFASKVPWVATSLEASLEC